MDFQDNIDWAKQFEALLSSPLGKELLRTLNEDLRASVVLSAENSDSLEKGYGLLKMAAGVNLAIGHLQSRAVVPTGEGSKDN